MYLIKSIKSKIILIVLFISFSFSCSIKYIPNNINNPLLNNSKEITGNISLGTSGIEPQLTYAFADNFAAMVNMNFYDSSDPSYTHVFAEAGLGYFNKINTNPNFKYAFFIGYGDGEVNPNTHFSRFFMLPYIGYYNKYFETVFATRLTYVNIYSELEEKYPHYFPTVEPGLTIKLGYGYIKAVLQAGLSIPATKNPPPYFPVFLSAGVQLDLFRAE